jgi:hypothetical protein
MFFVCENIVQCNSSEIQYQPANEEWKMENTNFLKNMIQQKIKSGKKPHKVKMAEPIGSS